MPTEAILQLLENGKWHYLKDITEKTCLNRYKVENVTKFLAKYSFVKLDEAEQKIKLDPPQAGSSRESDNWKTKRPLNSSHNIRCDFTTNWLL